jgi:hypothetical protein
MLIIVDGPNGAGKSTLVRRLIDEIKVRDPGTEVARLHKGPPTSHPLDEYETPLLGYRPGTGRHVICERWHVGELVYPTVLNRPTQMTTAVNRHIELFLMSRGAFMVHVTHANDDVIVEQFTQRDRVHGQITSEPVLRAVIQSFRQAVKHSRLPRIDCTNVLADAWPHYIVTAAQQHEEDAATLNAFTTYVGPPNPRVLLLGDTRNGEWRNGDGPAFGPYPATSGDFLMGHLPVELMRGLGVANACDVDCPRTLWQALGRPTVVALGRRSQACIKKWSGPRVVPHPQYVRRFFHREGDRYGRMIADVAADTWDGEVWWRH